MFGIDADFKYMC